MPITTVEVIEGGQKGQTVARATKLAVDKFFSLGVIKIQNECNNVARRYCAMWNAKSSELMSEYHFQISYTQGRSEIQPHLQYFGKVVVQPPVSCIAKR